MKGNHHSDGGTNNDAQMEQVEARTEQAELRADQAQLRTNRAEKS